MYESVCLIKKASFDADSKHKKYTEEFNKIETYIKEITDVTDSITQKFEKLGDLESERKDVDDIKVTLAELSFLCEKFKEQHICYESEFTKIQSTYS